MQNCPKLRQCFWQGVTPRNWQGYVTSLLTAH